MGQRGCAAGSGGLTEGRHGCEAVGSLEGEREKAVWRASEEQGEQGFLYLGLASLPLLRRGGVRIPVERSEQQEGRWF